MSASAYLFTQNSVNAIESSVEITNRLNVVKIATELPQEAIEALRGVVLFVWNICECKLNTLGRWAKYLTW